METFGMNLGFVFIQCAIEFGVFAFIVLVLALVEYRQPSKPLIILIGLATAWVTVYPVVFSSIWSLKLFFSLHSPSEDVALVKQIIDVPAPVTSLTFALGILLAIIYLFHIVKFPGHSKGERFLYAAGLLGASVIFMPVYYLCFVLRSANPVPPSPGLGKDEMF